MHGVAALGARACVAAAAGWLRARARLSRHVGVAERAQREMHHGVAVVRQPPRREGQPRERCGPALVPHARRAKRVERVYAHALPRELVRGERRVGAAERVARNEHLPQTE